MSSTPDGGPAFPTAARGERHGMTLRDYFAGQALAGELAGQSQGREWEDQSSLANWCYRVADAMLKERDK